MATGERFLLLFACSSVEDFERRVQRLEQVRASSSISHVIVLGEAKEIQLAKTYAALPLGALTFV